jgi:hypothetical protein
MLISSSLADSVSLELLSQSVSRLNVNCNWPSPLTDQPVGFMVQAPQMKDRLANPRCAACCHTENKEVAHPNTWQTMASLHYMVKVESRKHIMLKSYTAHANNRFHMHGRPKSYPKHSSGAGLLFKFLDSIRTSPNDKISVHMTKFNTQWNLNIRGCEGACQVK